jgi:hypothetical protein
MGWKADWLYRPVFEQFERAWAKAQKEGEGGLGPASAELLVTQYNEVNADHAPYCFGGQSVRSWRYTGQRWEESYSAERTTEDNAVHGMFYHRAAGSFCISEGRKTVIIEYLFGPLYVRGFVFCVRGQGKTAELVPQPDAVTWFS